MVGINDHNVSVAELLYIYITTIPYNNNIITIIDIKPLVINQCILDSKVILLEGYFIRDCSIGDFLCCNNCRVFFL